MVILQSSRRRVRLLLLLQTGKDVPHVRLCLTLLLFEKLANGDGRRERRDGEEALTTLTLRFLTRLAISLSISRCFVCSWSWICSRSCVMNLQRASTSQYFPSLLLTPIPSPAVHPISTPWPTHILPTPCQNRTSPCSSPSCFSVSWTRLFAFSDPCNWALTMLSCRVALINWLWIC